MSKKSDKQREDEESVLSYLEQRGQEIVASDYVRKNRAVTTVVGREQLFLSQLEETLRHAFKNKMSVPKTLTKSRGKTQRILNLIISDTHYGSALDPREVGHKYGAVEEARRTAAIVREVCNYKLDHRDETELFVHVIGDIIQGQLHDMRDGLPLAEQVAAAMRILIQVMRVFAVHFPRGVTFWCTPGNHGRNTARHRDRATNQKWDAIETMIYIALKEAARMIPNVKVVIGYEPKYDFEVFDRVGMGTHGDTVLSPGYPGKSINTESLSRQANSINNARVMNEKKPYSLFIVGHVHVGSMTHLPGGVIIITNGCLIPPDAYATSIGIMDTANGQWMFESVKGHIVGDARFITVDKHTDADASLDEIIQPSTGL